MTKKDLAQEIDSFLEYIERQDYKTIESDMTKTVLSTFSAWLKRNE